MSPLGCRGWPDDTQIRSPAADTRSTFRQGSDFQLVSDCKAYRLRRCAAFTWRHRAPPWDWHWTCYVLCGEKTVVDVAIDGIVHKGKPAELLVDLINRTG